MWCLWVACLFCEQMFVLPRVLENMLLNRNYAFLYVVCTFILYFHYTHLFIFSTVHIFINKTFVLNSFDRESLKLNGLNGH